MLISIDDGSNFVKIAYKINDNIEVDYFASRVVRGATPSGDASGFSSTSYNVDGIDYSVSKSAPDTIPTNTRDYQTSAINRVLIHHALRKIENGDDSFDVVLTLPVSQYFNQDGSKNEDLINRKIENAKGPISYLNQPEKTVKVGKVHVLPESIPAFCNAHDELNLQGDKYMIVDIGGTTTDVTIFDESNNIEKFKSLDIGALNMLSSFSALVTAKLNLNHLPDKLALQGLLSGLVAGQSVDEEVSHVLTAFNGRVMDNIKTMGDLRLFDGVIFSGGGANLMNSDFINVLKTDDPQMDNAIGSLMILDR